MIKPADVCGVIVTRGDVNVIPILTSFAGLGSFYVWDNSEGEDLAVYGRYAGIEAMARNPRIARDVVLVQDDDCILPPESIAALLAAYQPGHVVCNMAARFREHYPDSALVGFGAVFDRDLPQRAFARFSAQKWMLVPGEASFDRACDVVFTTLTPRILVDVPVQILDYAHDDTRMWRQPGHVGERQRMLALARQVRDAVPA